MRRRVTLLASALLVAACSRAKRAELPTDYPDIQGTVTRAEGVFLRVEEDPDAEAGSAKAVVLLTPRTRIIDAAGDSLARAALKEGVDVKVWFAGSVRESYPVQAAAGIVMLEGR